MPAEMPEQIHLVGRGRHPEMELVREELRRRAKAHFGNHEYHESADHEHGQHNGPATVEMTFTPGKADPPSS